MGLNNFSLFLSISILGNITIANLLINEKFLKSKIFPTIFYNIIIISTCDISDKSKKNLFFKSNLSILLVSFRDIPKSLKLYLILIYFFY